MTTEYKIQGGILLESQWHSEPPEIIVTVGKEKTCYHLYEPRWFDFDFKSSNLNETIKVEFVNKKETDTVPDQGLDKAVIIKQIQFFGITDPRFIWAGIYEPVYPEPWATQQQAQGVELKQQLTLHTYLGWNGKWTLTFDVPVFTWMHRIQNLGWIYC